MHKEKVRVQREVEMSAPKGAMAKERRVQGESATLLWPLRPATLLRRSPLVSPLGKAALAVDAGFCGL